MSDAAVQGSACPAMFSADSARELGGEDPFRLWHWGGAGTSGFVTCYILNMGVICDIVQKVNLSFKALYT